MMDKSIGSEKTIGGGLEEIQSVGDLLTQRQRKRFKAGDTLLGRYRILGELGQGGMGLVFRCLDEVGGIEVAVKMLPPEVGHDSGEMEEVRENFALVANLAHPNIATVRTLEKDPATGEYFLVMELAQGVNLRQWRKAEVRGRMSDVRGSDGGAGPPDPPKPGAPGGRALPLETILPIIHQIAAALDYAHEHKVIHRDIKPSNVMVQPATCNLSPSTCTVKVLDFGLAAQIHTSFSRVSQVRYGTSGTGPYMAPEQWRGQYQDGATDQYALAVLAYELIAGHCPFESHETTVLKQAVLDNEPARPKGLPETTWLALKRGLAKSREARFASCGDFAAALGGDKDKLRNAPNARKGTANGRKWTRIVAGLLALAGLAAGIWGWRSIQEPGFRSQNGADGAGTAGSVVGQGVDLAGSGSDGRAGPLDPPNENGAPGGRALPDTSPMATEDQQSEPVSVQVGFGHAKIQTTPEGALVTLAGQVATSRPVAVFRDVSAGPQPVRVELDHYRIEEFNLTIPVDKFAETNVVLAKRQGWLDLDTDPQGAAIWTNGVDSGFRTPWILDHDAGTVDLKFTLAGRRVWTTNAPVKGDETTKIRGIALVPESGAIRVVVTVPKEAQAYFDGLEKTVWIGTKEWKTNALPATWDGLDCVETPVRVEAPGFDSATVAVVVEDQTSTNVAIRMTPKPSRIRITSNAPDAEIIDAQGTRLGKAGDELTLNSFVTNTLTVKAQGYKERAPPSFTLKKPDTKFKDIHVTLEEIRDTEVVSNIKSTANEMESAVENQRLQAPNDKTALQPENSYEIVDPSSLANAPQYSWARAIRFNDVLENGPYGSPQRLDRRNYFLMQLKSAGTVWVPEGVVHKLRELNVGETYSFVGTVDQISRRYYIIVDGCIGIDGDALTPIVPFVGVEPTKADKAARKAAEKEAEEVLRRLAEEEKLALATVQKAEALARKKEAEDSKRAAAEARLAELAARKRLAEEEKLALAAVQKAEALARKKEAEDSKRAAAEARLTELAARKEAAEKAIGNLSAGNTQAIAGASYYFIQGEIRAPGKYQMTGAIRVSQAIAAAGGYTAYASGQVLVKRDGKAIKTIRNARRLESSPADDIPLEPDDIIEIKRSWF